MTIRQKLFMGFIGIALLIGAVSFISVNASQKALKKAVGENFVMVAEQILNDIDKQIYHRIEQIQVFAAGLADTDILTGSNREFEHVADSRGYIDKKVREWTSVPQGVRTGFMQELINNDLSNRLKEEIQSEGFYKERYGYVPFAELLVTNKYGANIAQTRKTSGYFQADEVWWQKAREDGLYVGDAEFNEGAGIYSITIGIRIDDREGGFLGVMKAVLNIEEVTNTLKIFELSKKEGHEAHHHEVYRSMHSDLITKDGKIIYSNEREFFENISGEGYIADALKFTGTDYFIARGRESEEELFAHSHSDGYKDYKGLGWVLIVMAEKNEVFAPVADLRDALILMSFGIMILAVIGSVFVSRSIVIPIFELKETAARIGKGDLDVDVDVRSKDEIGFLAASIKKMSGDLKRSQDELASYSKRLEEEVEERTKELEKARNDLGNTVQKRTVELQEKLAELERFRTATIDREFRIEELNREIERLKGEKR